MTAIIEALVWFCAGAAAGIAIEIWFRSGIVKLQDETIDELLASNQRLLGHIARLEKKRHRDDADYWKDQ